MLRRSGRLPAAGMTHPGAIARDANRRGAPVLPYRQCGLDLKEHTVLTSASPKAGRTYQVGGSRMNSDRVEGLEAALAGVGARGGPSPTGSLAWLLSARGWYFVSIGLVSLALALTLTLQQITVGRPSLFLFFAAIVTSAWFRRHGSWPSGRGAVGPGGRIFLFDPSGDYRHWRRQCRDARVLRRLRGCGRHPQRATTLSYGDAATNAS